MNVRVFFIRGAVATACAFGISACGGQGGLTSTGGIGTLPSATSEPSQSAKPATAVMIVKIPPKTAAALVHRDYVSASTQSVTVALLGRNGQPTQIAEGDLTPASPNCSSAAGGGIQCAVNLIAPSGAQTFVVNMYSQTGGKGSLLSTGDIAATLVAGQNTTIDVTLDGVPATSSIVLGTGSLPVGTAGTTSVTVMAEDASGNIIVGPGGYSTPISVAISGDTHRTLSLSANSVSSPGQLLTLTYDGGSNVGSKLTPSIGGTNGTPATFAATGAGLSDYVFDDNADGFTNTYPGAVAALGNGDAAIEGTDWVCCQNGPTYLELITPAGVQSAYTGDVQDFYNPPAAGSLTYTTLNVVHGMSANLAVWWGTSDSGIAVDGNNNIYYGAVETSASDPNCSSGTSSFGAIGTFNQAALAATEKATKGVPMYVQVDPSRNVWFVEESGSCSGTGSYFPSGYAIGELTAGGALTETDLGATGFPSGDTPDSMTLTPDGTAMYIADDSNYAIYKIPTASLSGASSITPANSTASYAMATAPDGTLAWFSGNEPGENYYYGYLAGSSAFASSSIIDTLFPIPTFQSYDMVNGDGSFWIAGYTADTGIGRLGNIPAAGGTVPLLNYYQVPSPESDPAELGGIAIGGGYVWSVDNDYGNIEALQYGAPSSATVTFSEARRSLNVRSMVTRMLAKNPHPHTLVHPHYGPSSVRHR